MSFLTRIISSARIILLPTVYLTLILKDNSETCHHKFVHPPLWYPRGIILWELRGHCIYDGFYMHQEPLVFMTVFRQNTRTRALLSNALPTKPPGSEKWKEKNKQEKGQIVILLFGGLCFFI